MEQKLRDVNLLTNFYFAPWGAAKGEIWEDISDNKEFSAPTTGHIVHAVLTGKRVLTHTERRLLRIVVNANE